MASVSYQQRIKCLSPLEKKVLTKYFLQNQSKVQIRKDLSLTVGKCNQLINSAYRKLLFGCEVKIDPPIMTPSQQKKWERNLIQEYKNKNVKVKRITPQTLVYNLPPGQLSIRIMNAILYNAPNGAKTTVGQLSKIPLEEMKKWKNLGPKSFKEVQEWLKKFNKQKKDR